MTLNAKAICDLRFFFNRQGARTVLVRSNVKSEPGPENLSDALETNFDRRHLSKLAADEDVRAPLGKMRSIHRTVWR